MLSLMPQFFDFQFYGPFFLRFALGIIFIAHGWKKLTGDKEPLAAWLDSLKLKPGKFWAWAATTNEFVGGLMLFFGIFMQFAALALALQFFVILFWVRAGQPFIAKEDAPGASWEFDFLIFFALLALLVLGPGMYAFDLPL